MIEFRYVTIGFLKKLLYGILNIRQEYKDIDDEYKPTYSEIIDGKYYPYFKDNVNANKIIVGLSIVNEYEDANSYVKIKDISVIYPKLSSLVINNDNLNFCPCGDEFDIETTGFFKILQRKESSESCIDERKCKVTPILLSNNNIFKIHGNKISASKNETENTYEGIITATYIYSGVTHANTILAIQEPNSISDWIFDNDIIDTIKISVSKTHLSSSGDECTFNVMKYFTKCLVKKDSCGNIIEKTKKSGFCEDITSLCSITLTNNASFVRNGNTITVKKQELNNGERHCIITAKYLNFVSSTKIMQEKGGEITYGYTLKFEEGNEKEFTLDSCFEQEVKIPLISTKDMYIDDIFYSSIIHKNLRLINDDSLTCDWIDFELEESDDNMLYIICKVIKSNLDKENYRNVTISYQNIDEPSLSVKLTIYQPYCRKIDTKYSIINKGFGVYDNDTIKDCKLTVYPLIQDVYEDGRIVAHEMSDNTLYFSYDYSSTDKNILDGGFLKKISFDGTHQLTLLYDINNSLNDVVLTCNFYLRDVNHDILDRCENLTVVYKHSDVVTNSYSFYCAENIDCNEYHVSWDNDDFSTKRVSIKSLKNVFVDGFLKGDEKVDFNISIVDNQGQFSVRNIDNEFVEIRPLSVNNDTLRESIFVLKQDKTNKEIKLFLTHFKTIKTTFNTLSIYLSSNDKNHEIWLENNPICEIYDDNMKLIKKLEMQKGWLAKNINSNDLILSYNSEFALNKKYIIKIKNIYYSTIEIGGNKIDDKTFEFVCQDNDEEIVINLEII